MNDVIFLEGLSIKPPHEKAPSWVKGKVSIKVNEFIEALKQHQNDKGWVNIDLKEAKSGGLYFSLDTYKKENVPDKKNDVEGEDINIEDIPF